MRKSWAARSTVFYQLASVIVFLYLFLVSIEMMGMAFKHASGGFTSQLMQSTSNPFIGLFLGILVTSLIQSSSTTTSIIVAMVGAGTLPLRSAVFMVMGANIGTTVTNTIVSFGYVGRRTEFERSFGASIVHDLFNISATIILFPLEYYFNIIQRSAVVIERMFVGMGGFTFTSPLKVITHPLSVFVSDLIGNSFILLVVALLLLFFSMSRIVVNMKGMIMEKIERVLNRFFFRSALISIVFGMLFTAVVQSSSITTSLIIPLVGAGIVTIEQVFPYTLGANIGTTITALLAALSVGTDAAMTLAFCHLMFNIYGIVLIYPIRIVPIGAAKLIAGFVSKSKKHFLVFLTIYILLHFIPIIFVKL